MMMLADLLSRQVTPLCLTRLRLNMLSGYKRHVGIATSRITCYQYVYASYIESTRFRIRVLDERRKLAIVTVSLMFPLRMTEKPLRMAKVCARVHLSKQFHGIFAMRS